MKKIKEYFQLEFEKEKNRMEAEFQKKEEALIRQWKEKIENLDKQYKNEFEIKKQVVIKNAINEAEKNFYNQLAIKRRNLLENFKKDILDILRKIDIQTKEKIENYFIEALKDKINILSNGNCLFKASLSAANLIRKNFPGVHVEEDSNIILGFYYVDDKVEVDATEKAIIERYLKKYES
jgi:hypothetical protein